MLRYFSGVALLLALLFTGCKKETVTDLNHSNTKARTTTTKTVQVLYIIPSDRKVNPEYMKAIREAAPILQEWYKQQMDGVTYHYANPLIVKLHSDQTAAWFSANNGSISGTDEQFYFFWNAYNEAKRLLGEKWNTEQYAYTVYVDAYGQTGAGIPGVAIMPENDLKGLSGHMEEPVSRWIGGWGHELGHAFGLPHPPDDSPYWYEAIMGYAYLTFPNAILLPSDKETLANSGFFY